MTQQSRALTYLKTPPFCKGIGPRPARPSLIIDFGKHLISSTVVLTTGSSLFSEAHAEAGSSQKMRRWTRDHPENLRALHRPD
jgi:hypothetical protein